MALAIPNATTAPSRSLSGTGVSAGPSRPLTPEHDANDAHGSGPAATVTISAQATLALSAQTNASVNYYAQFFPTRDGKPPAALALAVTNPGAVSSSGGKPLAQVATDARASLDAKYAEMKASGSPFDFDSWEGKDTYTLMGDLDRRSLYAISSNQGGQFSEQEQIIASSIMGQEAKLATGYYNGPTRLASAYVPPPGLTSTTADPFDGEAARAKATTKYLDRVSDDEKSSISWAYARSSAQLAYEAITEGEGKTPDHLDSQNALARLIADALKTMRHNLQRGMTYGAITTANDLKRQPWFQGFETRLDSLLARDNPRPVRAGLNITA
jgi:hypothetical protein